MPSNDRFNINIFLIFSKQIANYNTYNIKIANLYFIMAFKDYSTSLIVLVLALVYFQFFHHGHHQQHHSKFEVTQNKVIFHANWTKTLDDVCCLGKLQGAFSKQGVSDLDVSLSMSSFNQEELKQIFAVSKFQAYKNIKIDLSGLNISNSGVDHVLNLIQPSVQTLQLNLNGIQTKTGFGKAFAQRLNTLKNLNKLTVSLIMSIKDKQVQEFIRNHKPSSSLSTLHLILIGNQLTKQALKQVQPYFSSLTLKDLYLNLYANKLGAQGAQILSQSLRQQLNLENLQLDLYFNNITQTGTQNITTVIEEMQHLKSLQINFDFNYIKNEGAKALGKMLEKMKNLQSLNIGVASKNFGYLGFKYVISGVQKLSQLKKLVLRCGVNRVGYNGAEITKQMLAKLTNLQHLELGFYENYVGDDGIALLAEQVASMKSLRVVSLNFGFNDAKSYGLIRTLKSFLANQYESLHLGLSSNEFRDNDVKLAESYLSTLIKNNQKFILDFADTGISKTQLRRLESLFTDTNKKHKKQAKLSANSIIPEEEPAKSAPKQDKKPQSKPKQPETSQAQSKKPQKSTQTKQDASQQTKKNDENQKTSTQL